MGDLANLTAEMTIDSTIKMIINLTVLMGRAMAVHTLLENEEEDAEAPQLPDDILVEVDRLNQVPSGNSVPKLIVVVGFGYCHSSVAAVDLRA